MDKPEVVSVDWRLVTSAELRRLLSEGPPDQVMVFRAKEAWNLLVVRRHERWDEDGALVSATARAFGERHTDLAAFEERICDRWGTTAWETLVESGHDQDDELHSAWVAMRMRAELDRASVVDPDLATSAGYFSDRRLPAPGRDRPEWHQGALGAMSLHLGGLGWEVRTERPSLLPAADGINTVVGALRARRYGHEAAVVVRVDECGEIYPRLAEPGEVRGPRLSPIAADHDDRAWPDDQLRRLRERAALLADRSAERPAPDFHELDGPSDRGCSRGVERGGLGR
jgi:hypothetical protein